MNLRKNHPKNGSSHWTCLDDYLSKHQYQLLQEMSYTLNQWKERRPSRCWNYFISLVLRLSQYNSFPEQLLSKSEGQKRVLENFYAFISGFSRKKFINRTGAKYSILIRKSNKNYFIINSSSHLCFRLQRYDWNCR